MARPKREAPNYSDTPRVMGQCVEYKGHVIEVATGRIFGVEIATCADRGVGYRQVYFAKGKTMQAHRLIWEAVHGPIPTGMVINHINGVKHDNRIENLEVVTQSGNMQHAYRTGLAKGLKGNRHHRAKLTNIQVLAIRALAELGVSHTELSHRIGVSRSTISMIVRRDTWTHLHPFPARLEDM